MGGGGSGGAGAAIPPLGWKVEVVSPLRPLGDLGQFAARKISLRASSVVDRSEFCVGWQRTKKRSKKTEKNESFVHNS